MKQKTPFTSPRGAVKYPKLDQPYVWSDAKGSSVPEPTGEYSTKLVVSNKLAKPLIETIDAAIKASGIKPKYLPYKAEIDKDSEEPTGNTEFTFKMYGLSFTKSPQKPLLADAKGRPVKKANITPGSEIIVSGAIKVGSKSARMEMNSIQIVRLAPASTAEFAPIDEDDVFIADEDEDDEEVNQIDSAKEETTINDKIPF